MQTVYKVVTVDEMNHTIDETYVSSSVIAKALVAQANNKTFIPVSVFDTLAELQLNKVNQARARAIAKLTSEELEALGLEGGTTNRGETRNG